MKAPRPGRGRGQAQNARIAAAAMDMTATRPACRQGRLEAASVAGAISKRAKGLETPPVK